MIKTVLILIFGLLVFHTAKGQKGSLVYFMKNSGEAVMKKDSADYFLFIMPVDTSTGKLLYPIKEFYANGKPKLVGTSISQHSLKLDGSCIQYYQNGNKKSICNYKDGQLLGSITEYYPGRKLYAIKEATADYRLLLVTCWDTTGKVLAENGNGTWLKYNADFTKQISEGPITDSLEEGKWRVITDSVTYVTVYNRGFIISSTDPYRNLRLGEITTRPEKPAHLAGDNSMALFLQRSIKYPAVARENDVQGRVFVTFTIEKDGTVTNVKALKGIDKNLTDEAVRVMKLSRWQPATQNGLPVRVFFMVPVNFALQEE